MCTQRKRPNKYSQKKAVCKSGKEVSGDTKPAHILMMDLQPPVQFSSVQFSHSVLSDSVTPWTAACQASLSITNSCSLLKLTSIELVMPSNHLILYRPLLPPSIFPSIRVFSNESTHCIKWPNYWSFSFIISPPNEYSGLISFRKPVLADTVKCR